MMSMWTSSRTVSAASGNLRRRNGSPIWQIIQSKTPRLAGLGSQPLFGSGLYHKLPAIFVAFAISNSATVPVQCSPWQMTVMNSAPGRGFHWFAA